MQTTEHHGEANVELGGRFFEEPEVEKDHEMVFSSDLSSRKESQKSYESLLEHQI